MANQYLMGIHQFLSERILQVTAEISSNALEGDACGKRYLEGQLEELYAARKFLSTHYDLKSQTYY
jgi:hypothetical protein